MRNFSLTNGTRSRTPRVPFSDYARSILGASYELSVALVGDRRMRRLNRTYRGKDTATDVLAFELDKHSGEIILDMNAIGRTARRRGVTPSAYLKYVFIHAMLHLKGLAHGRTMDRLEDTWCRKFGIRKPS